MSRTRRSHQNRVKTDRDQKVTMLSDPGMYKGVVSAVVPGSPYVLDVTVVGYDKRVTLVWGAGLLSSLTLGVEAVMTPSVGTNCLFYWFGNEGIVIATYPNESIQVPSDLEKMGNTPVNDYTSYKLGELLSKIKAEGSRGVVKTNLVSGELDIGMAHGVGVSVLRNMAQLRAGELAKIEAFMLDDLVRVISDNFKHITCFGDHEIFNDGGRLNVRWDGSLYDWESLGLMDPTDPKASFSSKYDVEDEDPELKYLRTGRWRFSAFLGHLGNLFHAFVTDPVGELGRIGSDAFRAGRFRAGVNTDGSFLMQTRGSDIVFEQVVRIPVPAERKRREDIEGNRMDQDDITENFGVSNDPLADWIPDPEAPLFETAYKLRDYARWFSSYYSLAKFHRQGKDWEVPAESEVPMEDKDSNDPEKETANTAFTEEMGQLYENRYATIRMWKDGSITILNAYGASITATGPDIIHSAPRDLILEAGRNVITVAGKDINSKAWGSVETTAISGGVLSRGKRWVETLSDLGTVLIQSNASASNPDPDARVHNECGVVIRTSSDSDVLVSSMRDSVTSAPVGNHLQSGRNSISKVSGQVSYENPHNPAGRTVIANGTVASQTMRAGTMVSPIIKNRRISVKTPYEPSPGHASHVIGTTDNQELDYTRYMPAKPAGVDDTLDQLGDVQELRQIHFKYREDYDEEVYESLTQQELRLDGSAEYETWRQSDERLPGGMGQTLPFPGLGGKKVMYDPVSNERLDTPSQNKHFVNEGRAMTRKAWEQKRLKYPQPKGRGF